MEGFQKKTSSSRLLKVHTQQTSERNRRILKTKRRQKKPTHYLRRISLTAELSTALSSERLACSSGVLKKQAETQFASKQGFPRTDPSLQKHLFQEGPYFRKGNDPRRSEVQPRGKAGNDTAPPAADTPAEGGLPLRTG